MACWQGRNMNTSAPTRAECLLQIVGDAMKAEPALEAVKVDHDQRSISIALLGRPPSGEFERELAGTISRGK